MLDFLKRRPSKEDNTSNPPSLFNRLKAGLLRTGAVFTSGLSKLFSHKGAISAEDLKELEIVLLSADVGMETTKGILQSVVERMKKEDNPVLGTVVKEVMKSLLTSVEAPLQVPADIKPFVIMMVGVNGTGKTTTIGKLASRLKSEAKTVMLAAGDTFRAAAIEQLQVWGERNTMPVIAQHQGADSASVIFDALQSAKAKQVDVLIADTAGRLHNQDTLMEELKKIVKVLRKQDSALPHEVLLVLDATLGQNALQQARKFHEALSLTGIVLTKLDGTAKGGIIFSIAQTLHLPIRFIGIGESIDDLQPFNADEFVEALFSSEALPS